MKKLLLPLLFLLSCGTTQQVTGPTVYVHDTTKIIHTVYVDSVTIDTLDVRATDTVTITKRDTTVQLVTVSTDTGRYTVELFAIQYGDNLQQIQAAAMYCNDNPPYKLKLQPGVYKTSSAIVGAKIVNGAYRQVSFDMSGMFAAKDAPDQYLSIIAPQFWDKPAIAIQQGKGVVIQDIALQGGYMMAHSFGVSQVMGYRPEQWQDGISTFGRTNPYAGIAIDPFSDSTNFDGDEYQMYAGLHQWYLPGMNRSGSTAVKMIGLKIMQFVVGVVITPSFQANGELIDLINSQIGDCFSAYGWTQAQSKQNNIIGLMVWSSVHTILDGLRYGKQHGDGTYAPTVNGISIAGQVNRLIEAAAYTFGITICNVYGERLGAIGETGTNPFEPTVFRDCKFEFECEDGINSQDFLYQGKFVFFDNCSFRFYGDSLARFVLNPDHAVMTGGSVGLPPLLENDANTPMEMNHVTTFYGTTNDWLNRNDYDSTHIISQGMVHLMPGATGYFVGGNFGGVAHGDLLTTQCYNVEGGIEFIQGVKWNNYAPVGIVDYFSADTLFFKRAGKSILDTTAYPIFVCKYKSGFIP